MKKLNCLNNMPAGKRLYSMIMGEVAFEGVGGTGIYAGGDMYDMEGRYRCTGERVLFPSKDCRSWGLGNWQRCLIEPGDIVVACNTDPYIVKEIEANGQYAIVINDAALSQNIDIAYITGWASNDTRKELISRLKRIGYEIKGNDVVRIDFKYERGDIFTIVGTDRAFICSGNTIKGYPVAVGGIDVKGEFFLSKGGMYWTWQSVRPSTVEEKKNLILKMKDKGYVWDINKKELLEIGSETKKDKPGKFNVKDLKLFDRVLGRNSDTSNWQLDLFSHLSSMEVTVCVGHVWNQCIPYNEDTKDLLGTSKQPTDFYNIFQS